MTVGSLHFDICSWTTESVSQNCYLFLARHEKWPFWSFEVCRALIFLVHCYVGEALLKDQNTSMYVCTYDGSS